MVEKCLGRDVSGRKVSGREGSGREKSWNLAYIPGYGQYKVKGPMITVEADVTETLNEKVLPRQQELIPVALKRKLSYKGTVMEEMVSKSKVQAYFNYFKKFNHLFGDQILDMAIKVANNQFCHFGLI